MLILLVVVVVFCIVFPSLWVKHIIKKYAVEDESIPGTGGELARHLIERFQLTGVVVERAAPDQDHYDPAARAVRLSPAIYDGKSLSAVAIAAHEVGHAIQYHRDEQITRLRQKYTSAAISLERFAVAVLISIPLVTALLRVPQAAMFTGAIGVTMMLIAAFMQLLVLPMEWDASFNKALPVLRDGAYVTAEQEFAVRRILRAAALTYAAGALANMLRLWRWIAILKGVIR